MDPINFIVTLHLLVCPPGYSPHQNKPKPCHPRTISTIIVDRAKAPEACQELQRMIKTEYINGTSIVAKQCDVTP